MKPPPNLADLNKYTAPALRRLRERHHDTLDELANKLKKYTDKDNPHEFVREAEGGREGVSVEALFLYLDLYGLGLPDFGEFLEEVRDAQMANSTPLPSEPPPEAHEEADEDAVETRLDGLRSEKEEDETE